MNPGFVMEDGELEKVCWQGVDTTGGVVIEWEPVDISHFDKWSNLANKPLKNEAPKIPLGIGGEVEVLYYEFVAEVDDTEFKATALIPDNVNSWTIPAEFITLVKGLEVDGEPVEEIKFEIIVRVESGDFMDEDGEIVESRPGNQSAVEDCFAI